MTSEPVPGPPGGRSAGAVVVGVDGSEGSRHALDWALAEARLHRRPLRVVHAWLPPPPLSIDGIPVTQDVAAYEEEAEQLLRTMLPPGLDDIALEGRAVQAAAPDALLGELERGGSLLVVGSRGRGGFAGLLLGSVSEHCARHASGPVVVVPAAAPLPDARDVVVGVDGSDGSLAALDWAVDEAAARGAALVVVHAWWHPCWVPTLGLAGIPYAAELPSDSEQLLRLVVDDALGRARRRPRSVERLSVGDAAAPALLDRARGAGLLVVGSRGRGGFAGLLLGSISQHCIHHAPCAVAVIRSGA